MAITGKSNKTKPTGFFEGCRFLVELGVISQSAKKDIIQSIEANGGGIDFVVSKKTTHVITNEASLSSYKLKSAHTYGCTIVSVDYLNACIAAGKRVDEWKYSYVGETPASSLGNHKNATSYVGACLSEAYAGVSAVMNEVYPSHVNEVLSEGVLNIAALCAGLGAPVPNGKFPLKSIVNNLYFNVLFNKKAEKPTTTVVESHPIVQTPKTVVTQSTTKPTKSLVPTPLFREISPSASPRSSSSSSSYTRPSFPVLSSLSSTSSSSLSSTSTLSSLKPTTISTVAPKPATTSPVKPATTSVAQISSIAPTSSFSSSIRPLTSTTSSSFSFSFSSRTPTTSTTPASSAASAAAAVAPTTSSAIPAASKTVSYSFAQYEAERRKKREEEKAQREEENGSVLREREARRKEEEEQRKKAMEEKKLEILERRKQEDEERKQKNRELSEAREKRIAEERKKREQTLERLKQKAPHELLTTSFFQQWDAEENDRKMKQEWEAYAKEMAETQRKEQEKEKAARERADRLFAEKEKKIQEREEQQKLAVVERAALKIRRREEYERNKEEEAIRKKQEFEERQAKLLAEFIKRQEKRARKKLLQEHPEVQKNYDEHKIFIGGIKLDDIKAAKFKPELAQRVRDERINSILRMFDQFGPVHKRKVFADKGHCFITFEEKESVAKAIEGMKDAETRKKLVEEAKEAQKEHKMNPLCAPHPQFYVRIPNHKEKKKQPKQDDSDAASTTSSQDSTPFVEVTAKPTKPTPPSPPPPSSAKPAPAGPRTSTAIPSIASPPSLAEMNQQVPVDPSYPPPRFIRRPAVLKPKKKMPKAPKKIDFGDVNTFPTTTNVFGNLSDEEGEFED